LTIAYLENAAAGQIENLWANANFIGTWQKYVAPRFILRLVALSYVGWRVAIVGTLGLFQLAHSQEDRRQAVRVLGLVLCTGVATILALGPVPLLGGWFPVYQWLSAVVVGFSRVRSPVRFGCIASVAVSALAGLAVAAIAQRMRTGTRPLLWR